MCVQLVQRFLTLVFSNFYTHPKWSSTSKCLWPLWRCWMQTQFHTTETAKTAVTQRRPRVRAPRTSRRGRARSARTDTDDWAISRHGRDMVATCCDVNDDSILIMSTHVGDMAVASTHSIWSVKVHGNWAQTRVETELHRFIGYLPRKSCRNPSRKMWVADGEMARFSVDLSAVIRQKKWMHTLPISFTHVYVLYAILIGSRMTLIEVSGTPWPAAQTFECARNLMSGMLQHFRYFEIKWFQFVCPAETTDVPELHLAKSCRVGVDSSIAEMGCAETGQTCSRASSI